MAYMDGEEGCRCLAPYPPASPGYVSRVPDTNACFFFQMGRGVLGPDGAQVDIFIHKGGVVARHVTIHISPDFAGVSRVRGKSNNHPCTTSPRWRGVEGRGVGGSRFAMYTEVHRKTGRARTDFLASKLPRAQEAPRCRDSFAGRRSPAGKIVPDSHSHGHPRVGMYPHRPFLDKMGTSAV